MRFLFRSLALIFTAVFAATLLIRSQAASYPDLEQLLLPPTNCEMPCFLGIQPGVTRAGEATTILENHPWVGDVRNVGAGDRQVSSIRFDWSTDAPDFLFSFRDNALELSYGTEVVTGITLSFQASTGDVWRVITTRHTLDGQLLGEFIAVDGANCIEDMKAFYNAPPERIYYRVSTSTAYRMPYRPVRYRSNALRCD